MIEDVWVREVEAELRQYGADVVTEAVRADIAAQLDAEQPVEVPVAGGAAATDTTATSASTQSATTPGTSTPNTSTTAPASGETPPPESTASGSDTGPSPT